MKERVSIVGCGPGAEAYLTVAGREAIEQAEVLAGSLHLLNSFARAESIRIPVATQIDEALDAIVAHVEKGRRVAVLVSGDPGLCSFAAPVLRRLGREQCRVIPGISSVQLAAARLGMDWGDAVILSAHKTLPEIHLEALAQAKTIFILCGHHVSHAWVGELLAKLGQRRTIDVCQDLSLPTERVDRVDLATFQKMELSSRTIVVIT